MNKKCIFCHSPNSTEFYQPNSFFSSLPVYFCKTCGYYFNYGNIDKIIKQCRNYYKDEYWSEFQNRKKISFRKKLRNTWINFLLLIGSGSLNSISHHKILKPHLINKKTFFDIGCGDGINLRYWHKKRFKVCGLEPDKKNVQMINKIFKRKICRIGFIEELTLNEKYDLIYLSHVFEHLRKPHIFLKNIKNNLSSKGIIFISVPNCENKNILHRSIYEQPHLYHFTKMSLQKIFRKYGFKILSLDTFTERTKVSKRDKLLLQFKAFVFTFIFSLLKINNLKKDTGKRGSKLIIVCGV